MSAAIVDDDNEQVELLERMTRRHPRADRLAIERFSSIEDLVRRASPGGPALDIVLMDIRFEGDERTGIDAVAELFPEGCGTQVIYVTGYPEFCTRAYQTGHVHFLTKPVVEADFVGALDKALQAVDEAGAAAIGLTVGSRLVKVRHARSATLRATAARCAST